MLASPPATLVEYQIANGEEGALPPYVDAAAPLMSDELIAFLRNAGVDNLQIFGATIDEATTGMVHRTHRSVNVIGLVSCVDADASDPTIARVVIDLDRAHDLAFFRLAEEPARIVVHRRIKDRLERSDVGTKIDFHAAGLRDGLGR